MGHILIELFSKIPYFLEADKDNILELEVIGKQKRKVVLVAAALFIALKTKKSIAITLYKELNEERKTDTLRLQARARVRTSEIHPMNICNTCIYNIV